ncbi:MAG: histidine kinase [Bacteroidota bacterium]
MIEKAERQVFDIVAVNINDNLPDFSEINSSNKRLNLQLLKQALQKDPSELQLILEEVLNLPKKKQKELAELLRDTELSALINASKLVTDRLKFLTGLEEIIFDAELKNSLLERAQLHQILADNTWIFGEEFNISVNDRSLTEVLRAHKRLIGDDTVIDEPVKRVDNSNGIVDLMLSRDLKSSSKSEIQHLVIELKRPKAKITSTETTQIKSYAHAVSNDERFRGLNAKWDFWLISNELDTITDEDVNQKDREPGLLFESSRNKNPQIKIWVKTWSTIIKENKARLNFIKEKLEYQADKGEALKALKQSYSELLENTKTGEIIDEKVA